MWRKLTGVLIVVLAWNTHANAQVTVSVVVTGGTDTSIAVAPGGSFGVDLRVAVPDIVVTGLQLQLEASSPDLMDITGGTYNSVSWDDASMALSIDPAPLDTVGRTIIGSVPRGSTIRNSTTILATIHMTVDAAAPAGTYSLNATAIWAFNQAFAGMQGTPGPAFSVIVGSGGTPPGGGGGTTPPDDGGTTPPDDGGTNPPDDGGTNPPDDGGTNPPDDGGTNPPDDGGTAPTDDNGTTPPVVGRCGAGIVESLALSLTGLFLIGWPARRRRRSRS